MNKRAYRVFLQHRRVKSFKNSSTHIYSVSMTHAMNCARHKYKDSEWEAIAVELL